jgi:anti-anti-sigma regulatory factor
MANSLFSDTRPAPAIIRVKPWFLESNLSHRDRRRIVDLLANHRQVVLDLAEVTTTSGAGLHMISEWAESVRAAGGALALAHCSLTLLSLLGILRISNGLRIFPSLDEALESIEHDRSALARSA